MFEDSLFATNRRRTPQQRWAALASFLLQAAFVTFIVALPLFFTEALPIDAVRDLVMLPSPPHAALPPRAAESIRHVQPRQPATELEEGRFVFHRPAPGPLHRVIDDRDTETQQTCPGVCVPGGTENGGGENPLLKNILGSGTKTWTPPPVDPSTKSVRISFMDEGLLIHKVKPTYPPLAIATRQQGTVYLHAIIAKDGTIQQLQVISGPPFLIKAATDAVLQWRYKPYKLNGEPVEVDTTITVNFKLGG